MLSSTRLRAQGGSVSPQSAPLPSSSLLCLSTLPFSLSLYLHLPISLSLLGLFSLTFSRPLLFFMIILISLVFLFSPHNFLFLTLSYMLILFLISLFLHIFVVSLPCLPRYNLCFLSPSYSLSFPSPPTFSSFVPSSSSFVFLSHPILPSLPLSLSYNISLFKNFLSYLLPSLSLIPLFQITSQSVILYLAVKICNKTLLF